MKIGFIIIHGIGNQEEGYSKILQKNIINNYVVVHKRPPSDLIFQEVLWSPLIESSEKILFNATSNDTKLNFLRHFVIHTFGDVIAYQKIYTQNINVVSTDIYSQIHKLVKSNYDLLNEKVDEIYFLSHSLGAVIMSDFIWDFNKGNNNIIEFKNLFSFGTTIPLWILRDSTLNKPIHLDLHQKWINFYDEHDILGYPLENISPDYNKLAEKNQLIDKKINVGNFATSWNPLSHNGYWESDEMAKLIVQNL